MTARPAARARRALLAAGGTGGHLFPAQALAEELARRGWTVDLATDARGARYRDRFPAGRVHEIASATIRGRNPVALAATFLRLARGLVAAFRLLGRSAPAVVVGFGGYPTLPPLLAARLRRIPCLLHEQNAVMGRANRFLARFVDAIAVSFAEVAHVPEGARGRLRHTGIPVRRAVTEAAAVAYEAPRPGEDFRLLVFGGSQGARVFSERLPAAAALLPGAHRRRLRVVQQARPEDAAALAAAYAGLGIAAEIAAFFDDLPVRIAAAHLVVSRAGASTCAELCAIGRPAILVPLPGAIDNDQLMNAAALARRDAGLLLPQSEGTPERLAREIAGLMDAPQRLAALAAGARAQGAPDALDRLAGLVEDVAGTRRGNGT